jgi:hypothetical protein
MTTTDVAATASVGVATATTVAATTRGHHATTAAASAPATTTGISRRAQADQCSDRRQAKKGTHRDSPPKTKPLALFMIANELNVDAEKLSNLRLESIPKSLKYRNLSIFTIWQSMEFFRKWKQ